jgi:hypothetical protein
LPRLLESFKFQVPKSKFKEKDRERLLFLLTRFGDNIKIQKISGYKNQPGDTVQRPVDTVVAAIIAQLKPLVGLKLSIARRAADMRIFHFGPIRTVENGTVGDYALHIQCPWRIEGPQGIVTGRWDLWEFAEDSGNIDWGTWDYAKDENLQDRLVGLFLGNYDPQTRSYINESDGLVVEAVSGDRYGGATIALSGGYRLVLFPTGTKSEDWRLFRPETKEPRLVIAGGRIGEDI